LLEERRNAKTTGKTAQAQAQQFGGRFGGSGFRKTPEPAEKRLDHSLKRLRLRKIQKAEG